MSDKIKPSFEFRIEIIVEPDGDVFHAYCPALKGLHTCGNTEQEALVHAKDAASAYLRSIMKHHEPIPVGIIRPMRHRAHSSTTNDYPTNRVEDLVVNSA